MRTMELSYYLCSLLTHLSFLFELIGAVPIPTQPTCEENLFMCLEDKLCIPSSWVCDYSYDCVDKSDELGCHAESTTSPTRADCKEGEFTCRQDNYCIPIEWVCDKAIDCIDNSDETNCTATQCQQDEVRCKSSGHCIKKEWICDGESDCIDNSDEESCTKKTTTTEATRKLTTTEIIDPIDLASFIQSHNIKMFFPTDLSDSPQKNYLGNKIHSIYFETTTKEPVIKLVTDAPEEQIYTTPNSSSIESEFEGILLKDEISYNVPIFFTYSNNNLKINENVTPSISSGDDVLDSHSEAPSVITHRTLSSTPKVNMNQTEFFSTILHLNNFTEVDVAENISASETDAYSILTTTDRFPTDLPTTTDRFPTHLSTTPERFSTDLSNTTDRFPTDFSTTTDRFPTDFSTTTDRFHTDLSPTTNRFPINLSTTTDRFSSDLSNTTDRFSTDLSTTKLTITPTETFQATILPPALKSRPFESIIIRKINITTFTPTTSTPSTTTTTTTMRTTPMTTSPSTTTTTPPMTSPSTRATTPHPCRREEFFCSVDRTCIPVEWRCDLTQDCWDGSDERNCDLVRCPDDMLQCEQSGQCIFPAWLCDGARDCEDGSDERGC